MFLSKKYEQNLPQALPDPPPLWVLWRRGLEFYNGQPCMDLEKRLFEELSSAGMMWGLETFMKGVNRGVGLSILGSGEGGRARVLESF